VQAPDPAQEALIQKLLGGGGVRDHRVLRVGSLEVRHPLNEVCDGLPGLSLLCLSFEFLPRACLMEWLSRFESLPRAGPQSVVRTARLVTNCKEPNGEPSEDPTEVQEEPRLSCIDVTTLSFRILQHTCARVCSCVRVPARVLVRIGCACACTHKDQRQRSEPRKGAQNAALAASSTSTRNGSTTPSDRARFGRDASRK